MTLGTDSSGRDIAAESLLLLYVASGRKNSLAPPKSE